MMKLKAMPKMPAVNNRALSTGLYILKGAAIGLAFSTIAILIFALVIKVASLSDGVIPVVNMILKLISVFLAVWVSLRAIGEKGWLYGAITGVVYILLGFILFSILDGSLAPAGSLLIDMLTGVIAGAVSGIIVMYLKK